MTASRRAPGIPGGAMQRALTGLTIGVAKQMRAREQRDREMGFAEIEQQFQVKITGTAGGAFGFESATISFDYPFYYAPGQRDSELDRPHMTFGGEASTAVAISAVVTGWDVDAESGAIQGAVVAIGVSGAEVDYTGVVHLNFQGFAALGEDESIVING